MELLFSVQDQNMEMNNCKWILIRNVLGKSKIILGLLEGISTMLKGEVEVFKMKPQMHHAEEDSPVSVPTDLPKDDELHFGIELIDFSKAKARMLQTFDWALPTWGKKDFVPWPGAIRLHSFSKSEVQNRAM
ncbi:Peptidyl-prolyl cis-trans isomerase, FKBP-type [Corchorus olitorius]|uniref:peptidylprolyl isomerase n=1 Tax=Corchorus olitorius TaxID=93759 RepID=A0A1R3GMF0_9ROSI|nr:Peptidyl-prolyl cis-trans isomerase, FKBP-type [Corchorus olitorius]